MAADVFVLLVVAAVQAATELAPAVSVPALAAAQILVTVAAGRTNVRVCGRHHVEVLWAAQANTGRNRREKPLAAPAL